MLLEAVAAVLAHRVAQHAMIELVGYRRLLAWREPARGIRSMDANAFDHVLDPEVADPDSRGDQGVVDQVGAIAPDSAWGIGAAVLGAPVALAQSMTAVVAVDSSRVRNGISPG